MKIFKIDVSKVEMESENLFSGYVHLKIPNVKERMDIVKAMSGEGKAIDENDITSGMEMFSMVSEAVTEMKVKHSSGIEITNADDLTCYKEGFLLFQELSKYVMSGIPLGNGFAPL